MIGIIDTSSLLAIARYYLSIKDGNKLLFFLENKFRSHKLILLNTIHKESKYMQNGLILTTMPFLNNKDLIFNDENIIAPAPQKFSNQIDNNFCIRLKRKLLTDEEYALQKDIYMSSGDAKLLLYALNNISLEPIIITEETKISNDGKLFKKIPAICEFLNLKHQNITEWLSTNGVELTWNHPPIK